MRDPRDADPPHNIHTVSFAAVFRKGPRFGFYDEEQRLQSDIELTPHGYIGYGVNNFVGVYLVLDYETRAELKWLVWGQR